MKRCYEKPAKSALVAATALVLTLSISSCERKSRGRESVEEAPINVRAEHPVVRDMEEVIEVHGNLEPLVQAEVVSEVSGSVERLLKDEGDLVKKGELMAKIDDEEYRLSYKQSLSAYRVAKSDYESAKELFELGMSSRSDLEKMRRTYIDAEANLDLARIRLDNTEIKSPISGTVLECNTDLYRQVSAMEPLFRVADVSSFLIYITVTEKEMARIEKEQKVRVRVDALAEDDSSFPFTAQVRKIHPIVDPKTGTVKVEVLLPASDDRLRPGMFARLKIVTSVHRDALVIPRRAFTAEDENHVWVVKGEGASMVRVETGLSNQNGVEIVSGLSPDDLVIVAGQSAITPKSKVHVANIEDEGTGARDGQ